MDKVYFVLGFVYERHQSDLDLPRTSGYQLYVLTSAGGVHKSTSKRHDGQEGYDYPTNLEKNEAIKGNLRPRHHVYAANYKVIRATQNNNTMTLQTNN